jgi:6-phosphogluconolactonase
MKITRRLFTSIAVVSCVITLALTAAEPKPQPPSDSHYLAFIGTYTGKTGSKGIYAYEFDANKGKLTLKTLAAETESPSWVVIHPNGKFAYAANEASKASTVTAFSIDAKSGKLTQLNQVSAQGEDPCHLSIDKTGKYLFSANYTSGNVVVFPILADGKLGEPTANVKDAGSLGPNKERQEAPHAHWVQPTPDNKYVFVSDLGLDAILTYKFDAGKGTLTPNNPPAAKLTPGSGPRHVTFSPNGKYVYVVSELKNTVTAFSYDAAQGTLNESQILSTLPVLFSGRNDDAEVVPNPNGKWLYASNRGHDTIAVFAVNPADGTLTYTTEYPTGGKEPRHFAIDPTGQYLLAENQNSNTIAVFRIDAASGALKQVSLTENIPAPVCLVFLPR